YGSILGDLDSFFTDSEMFDQLLTLEDSATLTEQFIPMLLLVNTLLATIPPVMAMNKLRTEEKKGRLDHILGRAVSRTELMGVYLFIAIVNGFVMISLSSLGLCSAGNVTIDEGLAFVFIYLSSLS